MTRNLYLLALLIGITFQSFAQSGRGPMSTTAIGHMCVTLLSPAALSAGQDLSFNNVNLRSATGASYSEESASLAVADVDMNMASLKVMGSKTTYSVTVSNRAFGFNQNGNRISVGNFSASSDTDMSGSSTIYIGATMSINNRKHETSENTSPLAVTVNYN